MNNTKQLPLLWFLTGSIGDALMALALCDELAKLNPGTTSTLFVRRNPRVVKDLAARVPSARVVPVTPLHFLAALARPWQVVSAWKYERGLLKAMRAVFLLNPRTRIARFDIHRPATRRDAVAHYDFAKLVIDNFRILARAAGLKAPPEGSSASLSIATSMPQSFSLAQGSYIVFHPFGSNAHKSFPPERCRQLLEAFAAAHPELAFVVTAAAQDAAAAQEIVADIPRTQVAANMPILEVAGLIQNAALYLGVDTGITHLAAMLGQITLAIEHPEHPRWYPTYNPKTVMLLNDPAAAKEDRWNITSDTVTAAMVQALPRA